MGATAEKKGDTDVFIVEKLMQKRKVKRNGRNVVEFLVKWEGYGEQDCTWEPLEHLRDNCKELIEKFEDHTSKKRGADPNSLVSDKKSRRKEEEEDADIIEGLKINGILGATKIDDKLHVLLSWIDPSVGEEEQRSFIPAQALRKHHSGLLLDFYESKLQLLEADEAKPEGSASAEKPDADDE